MKKLSYTIVAVALALAVCGCPLPPLVLVTPADATVETGKTVQLTVSSSEPGDTFLWKSGDNAIASVDQSGLVRTFLSGKAVITAKGSVSGAQDTCIVTVVDVVTVKPESVAIKAWEETRLTASSTNPGDVFAWTSSDAAIASVDEATGLVHAWLPGSVTITAAGSVSGLSDTCAVTVLDAVVVEPASLTLKTGDEEQLTAMSTVPGDTFTWTCGNEMIARVDETGLVQVWWPGTVEITATGSVSGLQDSCLVTVLNRGSYPGPMVLGVPYEFTMDIGDEPGAGVWTWSGIGNYLESDPDISGWIGGGDAMGWNAGADGEWELALDWPFAFDGVEYTSVMVNNNGQVIFGDPDEYLYLSAFRTPLSTELEGQDIFVMRTGGFIAIRWACSPDEAPTALKQGEATINFEVVLERTGEIVINYGLITSDVEPRIGISTQYTGNASDLTRTALIPEGTSRVWTYEPGRTPPGLSLSEDGLISGTPTQAGDFFVVTHYSVDGDEVYYGVLGFSVYEELPSPGEWDKR